LAATGWPARRTQAAQQGEKETPTCARQEFEQKSPGPTSDLKAELAVDSSRLQGKQAIELEQREKNNMGGTYFELLPRLMPSTAQPALSELDITHTKFCGVLQQKAQRRNCRISSVKLFFHLKDLEMHLNCPCNQTSLSRLF